jgi:hypothetical protein
VGWRRWRRRILGTLVPAEDGKRKGAFLQGSLLPQQVVDEKGRGEHAAAGMFHQQVRLHPYEDHVSLPMHALADGVGGARGGCRKGGARAAPPRTLIGHPQKKLSSTLGLYVLIYSNLLRAEKQGVAQLNYFSSLPMLFARTGVLCVRFCFLGLRERCSIYAVCGGVYCACGIIWFIVYCRSVDEARLPANRTSRRFDT